MAFMPGQSKTICLGFSDELYYQEGVDDTAKFRQYLDSAYEQYPELFPMAFGGGYTLHSFIHSKKQAIRTRRVKLVEDEEVYQIRPSFLMSY